MRIAGYSIHEGTPKLTEGAKLQLRLGRAVQALTILDSLAYDCQKGAVEIGKDDSILVTFRGDDDTKCAIGATAFLNGIGGLVKNPTTEYEIDGVDYPTLQERAGGKEGYRVGNNAVVRRKDNADILVEIKLAHSLPDAIRYLQNVQSGPLRTIEEKDTKQRAAGTASAAVLAGRDSNAAFRG